MAQGALTLHPLTGIPEVHQDDDLAALMLRAAETAGLELRDGDVLVVSSKVVSKALGLWAPGDERDLAIRAATVRVVAERMTGDRVTQVVQSVAGPVMAAAGVDASNTGHRDDVLLLPADPDAEAERLRVAVLAATGLTSVGVVVSDTAGRPWRGGQTDFALGAAGVAVVDDLRGASDADGRGLAVTSRAVADALAAAGDLVKGKTLAVPAALVRGSGSAIPTRGQGARSLVRTGVQDWFAYGNAEAVRAALGVEPGTPTATEVGIPAGSEEPVHARLARAAAVALLAAPDAGIDVGPDQVQVSAPSGYALGVTVTRLQVALWGEGLELVEPPPDSDALTLTLDVRPR